MTTLWRRTSFATALVAALGFSQAPEYAQQYRQRLGGAIGELQRVIEAFDTDSHRAGLTHDEGVARLEGSADVFVRRRGVSIEQETERLERLKKQAANLEGDLPLARVFGLALGFDPTVADAAYRDFKPALPLTADGAASAAIGFAVVLLFLRLVAWPFARRRPRIGVG